uniref:Putative secreted peptide n=1 Tax=Anopheles braziliensis TaxID=58242 RepID=A0A2M3ZPW3_9DIPT
MIVATVTLVAVVPRSLTDKNDFCLTFEIFTFVLDNLANGFSSLNTLRKPICCSGLTSEISLSALKTGSLTLIFPLLFFSISASMFSKSLILKFSSSSSSLKRFAGSSSIIDISSPLYGSSTHNSF